MISRTLIAIAVFGVSLTNAAVPGFPSSWKEFESMDGSNMNTLFHRYKTAFNKRFSTISDEQQHLEVFAATVKNIFNWNAESHSYVKGISQFTDLSDEERKQFVMPDTPVKKNVKKSSTSSSPRSKKLNSLGDSTVCDLRPFMTSVKNQASCGSCWAFGTIAAAEASHFLWAETNSDGQYSSNVLNGNTYKDAWQLSEQVLMDCCDAKYDANGCGGGGASGPVQCAVDIGALPSAISNPYQAFSNFTCTSSKSQASAYVQDWYQPCDFGDEACLKSYIGGDFCGTFFTTALKTSIEVISSFYDYAGGVYSDPKCPNTYHNHAVAIVGWGTNTNTKQDYWILRNSWGPSWGENGYFLMERGTNMCCVACDNLFFQ